MIHTPGPALRPPGGPAAFAAPAALVVAALVLAAPRLSGHVAPDLSAPSSDSALVARVDSLHHAGAFQEELTLLRARLAPDSSGYPLLWRAARAALARGAELPGPYPQNHYFEEAMRWGALAEAEAVRGSLGPDGRPRRGPADVTGAYWGLEATGSRALNASASYGAELADRIWTDGYALLERAPDDPRLHSLLGRLQFKIMSLSRAERILGRLLVGADVLGRADWEGAERHLTRAVELAPSRTPYLLELARLHAARGRPTAARALAERVVASPSTDRAGRTAARDARDLLRRLGG